MHRILAVFVTLLVALTLSVPLSAEEGNSGKVQPPRTAKKSSKKVAKGAKRKAKAKAASGTVAKATAATDPPLVTEPAIVKELQAWSNPDFTRIAVTLDKECQYEYHQLPQKQETGTTSRLYLDLSAAKLTPGVKDLSVGDGLLKTARVGQFKQQTVRVVLDLESLKDFKVFTFSDPFRIIVDLKGERRAPQISQTKEIIQAAVPLPVKVETPQLREDKEKAKGTPRTVLHRIRRIVVDPGHGGHDPGAIGQGGTKEKDVVLQLGLKLAQKLRDDLGLDVVMTRSTDVFLELQERTGIANQVGADLFVSVHANASLNRSASGIETYYLNLAKTEKAAQLAAMENGTSLEKVSLLQAVLFDLMANYKLNDSALLAEEVQKAVHKRVNAGYSGVKNLGVKQGPFYVLVGATMPSILVESAFLSNEKEEGRLKDPKYLDATAEGIAEGIKSYISNLKTN